MTANITYDRPLFVDIDGKPLESGSVYVGVANQDPESFPVACYWDSGLTTPATQPLSVSAGYIMHNGARAPVYTASSSYSMRIRNRSGAQVDYVASESASATLEILAATTGAGLVGYLQTTSYATGTLGQAVSRLKFASLPPYSIKADGSTDDTAGWTALLAALNTGDIVYLPNGVSRISSTLTLGNGTSSSRSTLNNVTFICPGTIAHPTAFINTGSGLVRSGLVLEWHGASSGTMFKIAGPIHGIQFVGGVSLDGLNVAGTCFYARSFSNCDFTAIGTYNFTGKGLDLGAVSATTIGGDANGITSAGNHFGLVYSFSPTAAGSICLDLDGYRAAGGEDVTINTFDRIEYGICGNAGVGLLIEYTDFIMFGAVVGVVYGAISSSPAGVKLTAVATPFTAPTMIHFGMLAPGTGVGVAGGTNGQIHCALYAMNDGATLPTGISGFNVQRVCDDNVANNDGLAIGVYQRPKVYASSNGDGYYGKDSSGNVLFSVTRQGTAAHVAGYGTVDFEAGATGAPSTGFHAQVTTTGINLATGKTLSVNGTQVVGARGLAVTAPTGGTTVDSQARTAINDLISRLQAHGLIS